MNSLKRRTILAGLFTAAGFAAGMTLFKDQRGILAVDQVLSGGYNIIENRSEILLLCKSTFLQSLLIFLSGFTIFPLSIDLPLLAYRGFALGNAALFLSAAETRSIVAFTSYALITLVFTVLIVQYASNFRKAPKSSIIKNTIAYSYSFLMVSGAAIIIRVIPGYISNVLK